MSDVREVNTLIEFHEQIVSMLSVPFNVSDDGIPRRYSAEWHWPGCLPDTEVMLWDTPEQAWNSIIERLNEWEGMWTPADEEDANGPQDRSAFALKLERAARMNCVGVIEDDSGMLYVVEDTYTVTCGKCKRAFPDIYPAGRCPYEYDH